MAFADKKRRRARLVDMRRSSPRKIGMDVSREECPLFSALPLHPFLIAIFESGPIRTGTRTFHSRTLSLRTVHIVRSFQSVSNRARSNRRFTRACHVCFSLIYLINVRTSVSGAVSWTEGNEKERSDEVKIKDTCYDTETMILTLLIAFFCNLICPFTW